MTLTAKHEAELTKAGVKCQCGTPCDPLGPMPEPHPFTRAMPGWTPMGYVCPDCGNKYTSFERQEVAWQQFPKGVNE